MTHCALCQFILILMRWRLEVNLERLHEHSTSRNVLTTIKAPQAWIIACRPLHKAISAIRIYTVVGKSGCLVNFFRKSAPRSPAVVFVATKRSISPLTYLRKISPQTIVNRRYKPQHVSVVSESQPLIKFFRKSAPWAPAWLGSVAIKHSTVWYPDVLIFAVTGKLFFERCWPGTRGPLHSGGTGLCPLCPPHRCETNGQTTDFIICLANAAGNYDIVRRVGMIQELIMDRVGNISLSDVFSARDISILIDFLCSY